LILKTVYTVNQSIKSVIKKEKEDSRTQRFLYWFTQQTSYVQSLTHSKDFTKNDQLIKFTTLAHNKNTLHSAANHCWTYSRPRNHTESTVCFKNSHAETHNKSQLYRIHCI